MMTRSVLKCAVLTSMLLVALAAQAAPAQTDDLGRGFDASEPVPLRVSMITPDVGNRDLLCAFGGAPRSHNS